MSEAERRLHQALAAAHAEYAQSLTEQPPPPPQPPPPQPPPPPPAPPARPLAFPGAEGHGALASGWRKPETVVMSVTNLNSTGPGSLFWATMQSPEAQRDQPRIVVFRVSGTIRYTGPAIPGQVDSGQFGIRSNCYIAGQTSPGGIQLIAQLRSVNHVDDVCVRHIRVRTEPMRPETFVMTGKNLIVDHCSVGWGGNDALQLYASARRMLPHTDGTISRCLIHEAGAGHSTAYGVAGRDWPGEPDPEFITANEIRRFSLLHNLSANTSHRQPRIYGRDILVANNAVYRWGYRLGGTGADSHVDWINNHWRPGPLGAGDLLHHEHSQPGSHGTLFHRAPSLYVAGNVSPGRLHAGNNDFSRVYSRWMHPQNPVAPLPEWQRHSPIDMTGVPLRLVSGDEAWHDTVYDCGANQILLGSGLFGDGRDSTDMRVISNALNNLLPPGVTAANPWVMHPNQVGGFPVMPSLTPYADTNNDGISDEWAQKYLPSGAKATDITPSGYMFVEAFLGGITPDGSKIRR